MEQEGYDTTAAPSYPYNGGNYPKEPPVENPSGGYKGAINIKASTTSIQQGDTLSVDVVVNSDGASISDITIKIKFDSNVIEALDADPTTVGAQVQITDENFLEISNEVDNLSGEITLSLTSITGEPVNGKIALVEFEGVKTGTVSITVSQGDSGIITSDGDDILTSIQGATITVGASTTPKPENPTQPPEKIPETAVGGQLLTAIGVIILIVSLVSIILQRKHVSPED